MGATLRKKKGHYYGRFYDPERQPPRKEVALGTTYKDVALAALREKEKELAAGRWSPWEPKGERRPGWVTVQEAKDAFLASRSHKRPSTVRHYRSYIGQWNETLPPGMVLRSVTAAEVRPYLWATTYTPKVPEAKPKPLSPNARRARARHLRAFFAWAVKAGYLESDPMAAVELPKEEKKVPTYLTAGDVQRLLQAIEADYELKRTEGKAMEGEIVWLRDVVLFAVSTGLRRDEICSLRWNAVNLVDRHITVGRGHGTKSHHERPVPLAKPALEVLRRRRVGGSSDYVFTGRRGGKLNGDYVGKQFKGYVRLAKLSDDVNFHSLRHTCASWLVMKNVPLRVVQEILGHSSAQVTQRYAHLAPGAMREAMDSVFGEL